MSLSFLDRERTVAPRGYNRWLIPPAALAVHLSIGEVYAFSVFKNPLVAHFDTSLTAIGAIFSIAIVMLVFEGSGLPKVLYLVETRAQAIEHVSS